MLWHLKNVTEINVVSNVSYSSLQGCLAPVEVITPKGCMINPGEEAAVVGGNVLTSQRLVDVIFKAFQTCAASQVYNTTLFALKL